jgi:hypothetical protein
MFETFQSRCGLPVKFEEWQAVFVFAASRMARKDHLASPQ